MHKQVETRHLQLNKRILSLSVLIFFFLGNVTIHAEESADFYVTPILPTSQLSGTESYFNVSLAPNERETLKLTLMNAGNTPISISVTPHTAYTNNNGVVEYGRDVEEPNQSLEWSIDKLLATPGIVHLKANETKTIDITLKMPNKAFDGILTGGIRLQKVAESTKETEESQQLSIDNEFAYVIGVVARNNQEETQADLTLLDILPDQMNYRNVFSAVIQNSFPAFVNKLSVEAKITRKGNSEVLYQATKDDMQMAPNSSFDFPIPLMGDSFKSGTYIAEINASSGENTWEWRQEFTVKSEEAKTFNQSDVTIDHSFNWWLIVVITVIIILLGIIVALLIKQRKFDSISKKSE